MTNQHPITPPAELVQKWWDELLNKPEFVDSGHTTKLITMTVDKLNQICVTTAKWAADQELDACCDFLYDHEECDRNFHKKLRNHRRPKPLSPKQQAIADLEWIYDNQSTTAYDDRFDRIRRALETLSDD